MLTSLKSPRYHKNKPFPFQFQSSLNLYTQMAFRALKKSFLLHKANCEVKLKCHTLNELFLISIVKFLQSAFHDQLLPQSRLVKTTQKHNGWISFWRKNCVQSCMKYVWIVLHWRGKDRWNVTKKNFFFRYVVFIFSHIISDVLSHGYLQKLKFGVRENSRTANDDLTQAIISIFNDSKNSWFTFHL